MPTVWIPLNMRELSEGRETVQVVGRTIRQVINNLERECPGIKERLYDPEEDSLLAGLAVIIDGEAGQMGLLEQVQEDSEVHFLPALGGGKSADDESRLPLKKTPKSLAIWKRYSAKRVKEALHQSAGALKDVDGPALLRDIHEARQQDSQGRPAS